MMIIKSSSITTVYDVTKNPMFCLQEAIRAILNCLGFESSDLMTLSLSLLSSSNMSIKGGGGEGERISKGRSSEQQRITVFQEDVPYEGKQQAEADDPPQSQTLIIEAATRRRGRPPSRPGVGRGSPPQNN
ncbi:hypothetical protein HAX54_014494 [Datura stramonium]|uniref:Uncharacterized protein n=1 Tax=Datura stramonium TaxID=4076 RepID=A0ABS8RIV7_DATST|nr:hypothetical protein [Datura stramonium]